MIGIPLRDVIEERPMSVADVLDGDFCTSIDGVDRPLRRNAPRLHLVGQDAETRTLTYTFTATFHCTGSGDGRGGNARDRRKARRARRLWRSLPDVVIWKGTP